MKKTTRIVCMVLLLLTLLVPLAACSNNGDDKPSGGTSDTAKPSTPDTGGGDSSDTSAAQEEKFNLGGRTITVMERELQDGTTTYYEINAPEVSAEVINNALYERNLAIEEKLNITLKSLVLPADNATRRQKLETTMKADERICDFVMDYGGNTMYYAVNGMICDLNQLEYLNFDNPWWYTDTMNDTAINGKNAFAVGDMCTASYTSTAVIFFNKSLAKEYDIGDCYQLVEDGEWTYEKHMTMGKHVSGDLNANGVVDAGDRFMLIAANWYYQPYFYGMGYKLLGTDANGNPQLGELSESQYNALRSLIETVNSSDCWYKAKYDKQGSTTKTFQEGRGLFWVQLMVSSKSLRDAEFDFGILPLPKRDVSQEEYISYLHTKTSLISIPVSTPDMDTVACVIEQMCKMSGDIIRPAYFDVLFDGIIARDAESTKMLDIIYSNVYMDLVQPLVQTGFSLDTVLRNAMDMNMSGAVSSIWKSNLTKNQKVIETVIEAFDEKVN